LWHRNVRLRRKGRWGHIKARGKAKRRKRGGNGKTLGGDSLKKGGEGRDGETDWVFYSRRKKKTLDIKQFLVIKKERLNQRSIEAKPFN